MGKPHGLTLGAAPARLTGAGERVLALYYAEVADSGSRLRKFIVLHPGASCFSWLFLCTAAHASRNGLPGQLRSPVAVCAMLLRGAR